MRFLLSSILFRALPAGRVHQLHHTITADTALPRCPTSLVPCSCRFGYVPSHLDDAMDLLAHLTGPRPAGGRADHGDDTGGPYCDGIPAT
ncbi:hypothetical protein ACIBQ3_34210 [Streptomyces rubiginosohelvolus]|uniref:hypothetical protein n=1 Tax=Streptomyces rubiginosohelvolus TaxID=67362 RepID=UPI0037991060